MRTVHPSLSEPLSDAEREQLSAFLAFRSPRGALDFEWLDGFLCAIAIGPGGIAPAEYLPAVWGRIPGHARSSGKPVSATVLITSVIRHLNTIVRSFEREGRHLPWMAQPCPGSTAGARWSRGFMRAVDLRLVEWGPLFEDEDHGSAILPIAVLSGEVGPAWPGLVVTGSDEGKHVDLVMEGCTRIHRFFRARREAPRGDACRCGSGRSFRNCCQPGRTVH